jgi:hypothetical protein
MQENAIKFHLHFKNCHFLQQNAFEKNRPEVTAVAEEEEEEGISRRGHGG